MPRYDYFCEACASVEEHSHPFSDDPVIACPAGCADPMVRVIGVPKVQPSALATQGAGADVWFKNHKEKVMSRDRDAYKRARREGHQPAAVVGSAEREASADTLAEYLG